MLFSDSAKSARRMDHLLYATSVGIGVWQWSILETDDFADCFGKIEELEIDAIWMYTVLSLQFLIAIIFTIWRVCLMSFSEIHQMVKKNQPVQILSPKINTPKSNTTSGLNYLVATTARQPQEQERLLRIERTASKRLIVRRVPKKNSKKENDLNLVMRPQS